MEPSEWAAVPGNLRWAWQVLLRTWAMQVLMVSVENTVWKQGCRLARKWFTWSDGAYRSPSCQLGKPRGCCPSAGWSNSGLGGADLHWNPVDIPGLSYTRTTNTRWGRGLLTSWACRPENVKVWWVFTVPVKPVLVTTIMTIILSHSQTPQSH